MDDDREADNAMGGGVEDAAEELMLAMLMEAATFLLAVPESRKGGSPKEGWRGPRGAWQGSWGR
jgi:hypothetical protein